MNSLQVQRMMKAFAQEKHDQAAAAEPCEYISPAGLAQTKTTKEAVDYLTSKKCPKIDRIKKSAKNIKMEGPPGPETAPAKKSRAKKVAAPAAPAPAPVPALEVVAPAPKKVKAPKAVAPAAAPPAVPAPAAAAEKKKRAPTAYAAAVGRHRKAGLSFADAAKAAKAECDAKKKTQ
jgi:hypothetical protein